MFLDFGLSIHTYYSRSLYALRFVFLGSGLVRGVDWPTHSVKYHSKPVIVGIERSYG